MTGLSRAIVLAAAIVIGDPAAARAQHQPVAPTANAAPVVVEIDTDDPTDDRGVIELAGAYVDGIWTWVSYSFGAMFSAVTPPTPSAMIRNLQEGDQQTVFLAMIGDAGYKVKEIENGIGLPPDVTVKFGRIRNLSDADLDYIDRELARWQRRDPGVVADAQRAVITTLVSINQSDSYVVDSVRLRLLPLPQVKFSLAPTVGGLGWESSQLMRAIQRLDRRMADVKAK
ncbi:MAG: hypothetical protein WCO00_01015 [Rhodospirillaceae bacterium]